MKLSILLALYLALLPARADSGDLETELSGLARRLANSIKSKGMKKITVLDFADFQNRTSELGKYVAEEMTINFVSEDSGFAVLDRANLRSILEEHKLTAKGLIDPENAKKIGMFAGVDALVLGTIVPKKESVGITARVITTETAEIIAAGKAEFRSTETIRELLTTATQENKEREKGEWNDASDTATVTKAIGDLRIQFTSLKVLNDGDYMLSMTVTNTSRKSVWVAINERSGEKNIQLTDSEGREFQTRSGQVRGFKQSTYYDGSLTFTEIKPKSAIDTSVKFSGSNREAATSGTCRLELELAISEKAGARRSEDYTIQNIVAKLEAK